MSKLKVNPPLRNELVDRVTRKLLNIPEGKTTQQMIHAPINSTYVWCNTTLQYPQNLARNLGRTDLKIHSPDFFMNNDKWQRHSGCHLVIDHALDILRYSPNWFQRYINVTSYFRSVNRLIVGADNQDPAIFPGHLIKSIGGNFP